MILHCSVAEASLRCWENNFQEEDHLAVLVGVPSSKLTQLWKITIFHGKFHYFYGHFPSLFVCLPEGNKVILPLKIIHGSNLIQSIDKLSSPIVWENAKPIFRQPQAILMYLELSSNNIPPLAMMSYVTQQVVSYFTQSTIVTENGSGLPTTPHMCSYK